MVNFLELSIKSLQMEFAQLCSYFPFILLLRVCSKFPPKLINICKTCDHHRTIYRLII